MSHRANPFRAGDTTKVLVSPPRFGLQRPLRLQGPKTLVEAYIHYLGVYRFRLDNDLRHQQRRFG